MNCPSCHYPIISKECDNPGCIANPSIPQSTKDRWARERVQREAEEAEREKFARIRNACYSK